MTLLWCWNQPSIGRVFNYIYIHMYIYNLIYENSHEVYLCIYIYIQLYIYTNKYEKVDCNDALMVLEPAFYEPCLHEKISQKNSSRGSTGIYMMMMMMFT
jgi:hypothetical protein